MTKRSLQYLGVAILSLGILTAYTHAQSNDFSIIPQTNNDAGVKQAVTDVGKNGGKVWDTYNAKATGFENNGALGDQMASGIMTRNTLLDYVVYVVKFLSQIGLTIGAFMIIYAGYMYATEIFGGKSGEGKKAITNAIIGILVISFSYAIMKILVSAFIS